MSTDPGTATHSLLSRAFEELTDRYTDTCVRDDTAVRFLPSGVSSYRMRWELIEKARHHIHLVAFSLMKDETGSRLRDALMKKLRQNVEVRMIFDDGVMLATLSGEILRDLEAAGAKTIRYHKVLRDWLPDFCKGHPLRQMANIFKYKLKRRFHEKYMIVDGKEALSTASWRQSVHTTSPAVQRSTTRRATWLSMAVPCPQRSGGSSRSTSRTAGRSAWKRRKGSIRSTTPSGARSRNATA
jgi:phosphatidylserine/phosphatidylglycerophosphate/cardiolipin synthase-like enzyme